MLYHKDSFIFKIKIKNKNLFKKEKNLQNTSKNQ